MNSSQQIEYVKLGEYAEAHGGRLMSSRFLKAYLPMTFQCAEMHLFSLLPKSIWKHQKWCPRCKRVRVRHCSSHLLEQIQGNGGRIIEIDRSEVKSGEKKKGHQRVTIACGMDHLFTEKVKKILKGSSWCTICEDLYLRQVAEDNRLTIVKRKGKSITVMCEYGHATTIRVQEFMDLGGNEDEEEQEGIEIMGDTIREEDERVKEIVEPIHHHRGDPTFICPECYSVDFPDIPVLQL